MSVSTANSPAAPAARAAVDPFLIVSCDLVKTGGMDRANYALAAYAASRGGEVHAVAHAAAADLIARPNVTFHRVPKPLGSYLLGEALLGRAGRRWAKTLLPRGGRVLVNGGNCAWGDANWVHYVHAAYTPQVRLGALRRLKGAVSHRRFLAGERAALGQARIVFANSQRTRDDLVRLLGVPADRIRTIYYGIDPQRFRPPTADERVAAREKMGWPVGQPVIAFIGALGDRRKGFDTLLDAWARLAGDRSWDARLVVMGAGGELDHWKRRAADAGLGASVEFLGFRRDVPDILKGCDALVAPTRYEAYGLGVQEALCCGLPAIVSATAGVAERYPGELRDLLLPDPDSAADLADRLRAWRSRQDWYNAALIPLAAALRAHTWDDMAEEMLRVMAA